MKLGVSEDMAMLIVISKYNPGSNESKFLIDEEIDFQNDIKNSMLEFIEVKNSIIELESESK